MKDIMLQVSLARAQSHPQQQQINDTAESTSTLQLTQLQRKSEGEISSVVKIGGENGQESGSAAGKVLREAATVQDFVSPLLALMPTAVQGLLTTFDPVEVSSPCHCGETEDGLVLQAIQATPAYRELSRLERVNHTRHDIDNDKGKEIGSSVIDNGSNGRVNVASEENEHNCGCSTRHSLSMVTYAVLHLLHKQEIVADSGREKRQVEDKSQQSTASVAGSSSSPTLWSVDPLAELPKPVAAEAIRVAQIMLGLVEMEQVDGHYCCPQEQPPPA